MMALPRPSLAERLWIYQSERFPVLKHGPLIAAFALAGAALPVLTENRAPDWTGALIAVAASLLFFLELRIADEHKDHKDDCRFRPERPVPRGLVSLAELRWVALAAALIQAALAWAYAPALLAPLALTWAWMGLMTVEFFAPNWLKRRPALYLASHMLVLPLIAAFAMAAAWGQSSLAANAPIIAFLALAFSNGVVIELARKSWARAEERRGVDTYSKLWGPERAAALIAGAIVASVALTLVVLGGARVAIWFAAAALVLAVSALIGPFAYALRPTPARAKLCETLAGVWVLGSYALIGLAAAWEIGA